MAQSAYQKQQETLKKADAAVAATGPYLSNKITKETPTTPPEEIHAAAEETLANRYTKLASGATDTANQGLLKLIPVTTVVNKLPNTTATTAKKWTGGTTAPTAPTTDWKTEIRKQVPTGKITSAADAATIFQRGLRAQLAKGKAK